MNSSISIWNLITLARWNLFIQFARVCRVFSYAESTKNHLPANCTRAREPAEQADEYRISCRWNRVCKSLVSSSLKIHTANSWLNRNFNWLLLDRCVCFRCLANILRIYTRMILPALYREEFGCLICLRLGTLLVYIPPVWSNQVPSER